MRQSTPETLRVPTEKNSRSARRQSNIVAELAPKPTGRRQTSHPTDWPRELRARKLFWPSDNGCVPPLHHRFREQPGAAVADPRLAAAFRIRAFGIDSFEQLPLAGAKSFRPGGRCDRRPRHRDVLPWNRRIHPGAFYGTAAS